VAQNAFRTFNGEKISNAQQNRVTLLAVKKLSLEAAGHSAPHAPNMRNSPAHHDEVNSIFVSMLR